VKGGMENLELIQPDNSSSISHDNAILQKLKDLTFVQLHWPSRQLSSHPFDSFEIMKIQEAKMKVKVENININFRISVSLY
jgi:hypothetical protein